MINLWYNSDEVTGFHPVVETAINAAIVSCGYDDIFQLEHHPAIPNSTIIPDFAIKLRTSQRYVFVIEVKKTPRDVISQRFQNQSRSYVTDFSSHWEPGYPPYFCLTNIEELILFADRNGPISACILKGNPKSHTPFDPSARDATITAAEFQSTFAAILHTIYNRTEPQWDNNWPPIIDSFHQNYISISQALHCSRELANELSLYELFRLLAFTYLKEYYSQIGNPNQAFFRNHPLNAVNINDFNHILSNNYARVLQLDFSQVFTNHPNSDDRIFPENFGISIWHYFKDAIQDFDRFGSQAVADNSSPKYIFDLLTSKIYDKEALHKKGKVMSDTELSTLLACLTIDSGSSSVLDPCSGDGALVDAAYDCLKEINLANNVPKSHNQLLDQVSGIEIDPFLAQLSTFRLVAKNLACIDRDTHINIHTGNTFQRPLSCEVDVLLMNPPYVRNDNPNAPITDSEKTLMHRAISDNAQENFVALASQPNLYLYFVNYVWHYLNARGRAGFILMAKFLNNQEGLFLKSFLLDKIEAVVLYPRNYFDDFRVTTVITVLSKQPSDHIKFLRITNAELLSQPDDIKSILNRNMTTLVTPDYSLKVTNRTISASENWRMHLVDPEDKFQKLACLNLLLPLNRFFTTIKRGGAENSGGSKVIFPDFDDPQYSGVNNIHSGLGVKNNRIRRNLVLTMADLNYEKALHLPAAYDDLTQNGLAAASQNDTCLNIIYNINNQANPVKWKKIVNSAYRNKVSFDILIPRADRSKHVCYYNRIAAEVVLTTNFFYFSGLTNFNADNRISPASQIKFIAAFLNSCFGQIQFEIHSNNQEGLRKIEGFHISEFKVPDLSVLSKTEIDSVCSAFSDFNSMDVLVSGLEGLSTPRKELDKTIASIIFSRDDLGFSTSERLTDHFELFLADLVEDRQL